MFKWNGKRRRAVELVAQDILTDVEIAKKLQTNKTTLERWKRHPAFAAAVEEAIAAEVAALKAEGIANKQNRIDEAKQRHDALKVITGERGADEHIGSFPGGKTGFVAASLKLIKIIDETVEDEHGNKHTEIRYKEFWEHSFDKSLFDAFASLEKQIAQETGQWEEKIEQSVLLRREITVVESPAGVMPGAIDREPEDDPIP
jgi:hypothetical protein